MRDSKTGLENALVLCCSDQKLLLHYLANCAFLHALECNSFVCPDCLTVRLFEQNVLKDQAQFCLIRGRHMSEITRREKSDNSSMSTVGA